VRYIPSSREERIDMLRSIGLESVDELFSCIPEHLLLDRALDLPPAHSETELLGVFRELAARNNASAGTFLGAGAYHHFIPVVIDHLALRSEWYTAYTPYQPEQSQGTLQAIFEFQTMICQLTGMDVANASLYDGSTALAEATLMALRLNRNRVRIAVPHNLHPHYRQVLQTYLSNLDVEIDSVASGSDGRVAAESLRLDANTAALVVQSPNFFGAIEDVASLARLAHASGALLIVVVVEGASLGILKAPGDLGADIVCGEAQSFGIPVSFGGPYAGFFATREAYVRQMPGRLVGRAHDAHGNRGFVLTLSTREQHIRREKATSNICTNQGLFMLMATIYLATLGRTGLREVAEQNVAKAHYAAERIAALNGFSLAFPSPFFNEFVVRTPGDAADLVERLRARRVVPGLALGRFYPELANCLLIAVTETVPRADIDRLVDALAEA
jgi:glycine dehydrogenase subunit 1